MSLPHQTPARKPLRALLYAPFVAVLLLALAWSAGWFWLRGDVLRRMDTARTAWRAAGHDLGWTARTLSGFPFRLDLDLSDARMGDGSGWAISTPRLNAEAFVFSPSHWVLVAPGAGTITRRSAGPVIVHAKVLRASLSDFAARPLRLSVEGLALTFDAPPGEKPFLLASAAEFHLHTRAGPDDQGALYLGLENAAPAHGGALERVAAGQSVNLTLDGLYDHAAAMRGRDWPDSLQAWKAAGGAFNLRLLKIEAGGASLEARSGHASAGADGRLRGSILAQIKGAPGLLSALGAGGALSLEAAHAATMIVGLDRRGPAVRTTLDFEAGRMTLGPVALGPAPRIY